MPSAGPFTLTEREALDLLDRILSGQLTMLNVSRMWEASRDIDNVQIEAGFGYARRSSKQDEEYLIFLKEGIYHGNIHVRGVNAYGPGAMQLQLEVPGYLIHPNYGYPHPNHVSYTRRRDPLQDMTLAIQQLSKATSQVKFTGSEKKRKIKNIGTKDEAILAYRDFDIEYRVWNSPWLKSRNGHFWPRFEPLVAVCSASAKTTLAATATHDAPKADCNCGIYAFENHKHPDLKKDAIAWGEILIWGEVLICETGFRAEFAYPKTVFVRNNGTKVIRMVATKLEELYGIPVHVVGERGKTSGDLMDEWIKGILK